MNEDEDFVKEHEAMVLAITIGTAVSVVICLLLLYYGVMP